MAVVRQMPGESLFERRLPRWKRLMDVTGAMAGLILLSPLMALVALYIKMVSPGPALFRQVRVGQLGKPFVLYKFRTMEVDADESLHREHLVALIRGGGARGGGSAEPAMAKLGRDPRVIRHGNLLRNLYLDELPQLYNVLRGDMALVGPRPAIPYEAEEYAVWHAWRLDVVPGMTGLWQVSGKNSLTFPQMVSLDIRYARELSFWLDLKILLRTVSAVGRETRKYLGRIW